MIGIIYIIFGLVKEKVSLKLGGGLSLLYSCPNHELSREIIIQNFYARLSRNDQPMLNTSYAGSFMKKTIEFRSDLLEIIKRNSEDWKLDEVNESGIEPKFDCVKSFMNTDAFQNLPLNMELTLR